MIKNSQLETLSAIGREEFIKKMMDLLRKDYKEIRETPMRELHDDIAIQIEKARKYGFTLNSTLATYIVSAFAMGENFDTDFSAANEILASGLHEVEKGEKLENWVVEIFIAFENN